MCETVQTRVRWSDDSCGPRRQLHLKLVESGTVHMVMVLEAWKKNISNEVTEACTMVSGDAVARRHAARFPEEGLRGHSTEWWRWNLNYNEDLAILKMRETWATHKENREKASVGLLLQFRYRPQGLSNHLLPSISVWFGCHCCFKAALINPDFFFHPLASGPVENLTKIEVWNGVLPSMGQERADREAG